ncbi:hypothetical protein PSTG_14950 [Puccinia striiformis f. sp. tritici PST-78]|uniref:Chromo domain-containing protein n=1 Tax=Puccinia striiformis f. sp. tritici PST-78 TaxID=1165861 RepID=A0A0L0UX73_9BASI|nr:hypothetical protein PSTG_14950 [Puccinia striiformis f. sp. tritici PST-78]
MVGSDAVEVDINKEYKRLHPVFNVSLVVKYYGPNELLDREKLIGMKDKYYEDKEVVDWKQIRDILDAREVKKGQYEYLISWKNSVVGNDTWVAEQHIPSSIAPYLNSFRQKHGNVFGSKKKRKQKAGENLE